MNEYGEVIRPNSYTTQLTEKHFIHDCDCICKLCHLQRKRTKNKNVKYIKYTIYSIIVIAGTYILFSMFEDAVLPPKKNTDFESLSPSSSANNISTSMTSSTRQSSLI